jgi:nitrate reductase molybdenum cofactor assembly chaperone NarJ/NarW
MTRLVGATHPADAAVWQSAALLLGYPDDRLLEDLRVVRRILEHVATERAEPLRRVLDHLATTPLVELQAAYVETFDTRRRHNLYLTYFAHGDTRKRGTALLRFKQTYLAAGFAIEQDAGGELPDHLCVVLEFAATVDRDQGRRLLLDHRAGLELLRLSLAEMGSPWAGAVEAVCATLPPLRGDERDAVRRLAASGPPAEEVGLSPYGGPAFDALLHETVDLPMPALRQETRT